VKVVVFTLEAMLCPRGRVSVRVFEAQYLDAIKDCMKNDLPLVSVAINPQAKGGVDLPFYRQGCLAKVVDFDLDDDGVLAVVLEGVESVLFTQTYRTDKKLWYADCEPVSASTHSDERSQHLPQNYDDLIEILKALVKHPSIEELNLTIDYEDAEQVSLRLVELLPFPLEEKQRLYEQSELVSRLESISQTVLEMI